MPNKTTIGGLYLVGHWSTGGIGQMGVPGVALSGRKVAELVLSDFGRNWEYGIMRT